MKMINRIYISGPITGVEYYNENFATAAEMLEKKGYKVVNPAQLDLVLPEDKTYEECMKVCMMLLEMCDTIYMLKGWERSLGANRELGYAVARGYTVIKEV